MKNFLSGLLMLIGFNALVGMLGGATLGAWRNTTWQGAIIGAVAVAALAIPEYLYAFWRKWDSHDPLLSMVKAIRSFFVFYIPVFVLAIAISGVVHMFNDGFARNVAISLRIAGIATLLLYLTAKRRK